MSNPKGGAPEADRPVGPAPDFAKQEWHEQINNGVPMRGYEMVPVIGIGGSAGCIPALQAFFSAMPEQSGMAFVVVLHMATDRESLLSEVLARSTAMPVMQVTDAMKPEPNCVYVIPPGRDLVLTDDRLRLTKLKRGQNRPTVVDRFFRSLADMHGPHATAIVLSGTGGDGAFGIKRTREHGGLTIAQDPAEAEYDGMPTAAIATGMVDWVLKVAAMPERLLEYHRLRQRIDLPPEELTPASAPHPAGDGETLQELLRLLQLRTGRDFSCYKRGTVLRRIARRMWVNREETVPGYLELFRTQPDEAGALLNDLLISVTNFFRDHDAFAELERHLPGLFAGRSASDTLRIWVPACATGEEAYSIAMLLLEYATPMDLRPVIQIFACDLRADAIQLARAGLYPAAISADVSPERLQRFFTKEPAGYRVRKELREMVLFGVHDLLKDPPFSRIDLISCRNLLIYLRTEAHTRALATFHYALRPGGMLFLGAAESATEVPQLFSEVHPKYRLYTPRPSAGSRSPLLVGTLAAHVRPDHAPMLPQSGLNPGLGGVWARDAIESDGKRISWAEMHYRLLELGSPPSLLVNADHEILHMSESVGRFLQLAGGEPSKDLLRLVHPMLQIELRTLLFRAARTGEVTQALGVRLEIGGERTEVDLRVFPGRRIAPDYQLVVFAERAPAAKSDPAPAVTNPIVDELARELEQMRERQRETDAKSETSNYDLRASNQELEAANEELLTATEELETSKQELNSLNEEMVTINAELKFKVDELARTNADLHNLMAATTIATVFLDRELCISRFTPAAVANFHLIPGDVGRPLSDLRHSLDYAELQADAAQVLNSQNPIQREVSDAGGRCYQVRVLPYQATDGGDAGVLLTLVDITELIRTQTELRTSEERLRLVLESAKEYAIFTVDRERRVISWNAGAKALFGYPEEDILGKSANLFYTDEDLARDAPQHLIHRALAKGRADYECWLVRRDQSTFYGSGSVMPIRDCTGRLQGFLKIIRDLTETQRVQADLKAQVGELVRFNHAAEGRELRMIELKREINALVGRLGEPARYSLAFDEERRVESS